MARLHLGVVSASSNCEEVLDAAPISVFFEHGATAAARRKDVLTTTEPIEPAVDHVRGPASAPLILEYGDYECPYSRRADREIQRLAARRSGGVRFAFRHFPLTDLHPHALAAAAAVEAAGLQGRFWEMHDLLFQRQEALEDEDLRRYARELGLDIHGFDADRVSEPVLLRIERDVRSGIATGEVRGTPTIFIDGVIHGGGYDADTLLEAIMR